MLLLNFNKRLSGSPIICSNSQCSMLSVYLKCVLRFFQWLRISNREFVSNFALQMEFCSTLSKTRAYQWCSAFKSGRDVVEHLPRSGRPSTSSTEVNIAKVKKIVTENRHLSLRKVAAELSVSHESIRTISNDCSGMKRVDSWCFFNRLCNKCTLELNLTMNSRYINKFRILFRSKNGFVASV